MRRSAYTLLELLLVLALLVVLVSISWPVVMRIYSDHQLKAAAEDVRSRLAGTRIQAIDAAVPYQFLYEPNGHRFLILPQELPPEASAMSSMATQPAATEATYKLLGELPETLFFQPVLENEPVQQLAQDYVADFSNSTELTSVAWGAPVLFFPDGSTSDAIFRLVDTEQRAIEISVRGLTGAVSLSRVQQEVGQ